jgi:tetratricopeptide (TPR) repeat protein
MLQPKKVLILLSLLISTGVLACINEYRTLLTGEVIYTHPVSGKIWTQKIDTFKLREKSNTLLLKYKTTDSIEYLSDYAASLIYLKNYNKAKTIYEDIDRKHPNLYTTASNLGTIYELIGKPQQALKWIKKSITLNPDSHNGSEWIHIKILEFKINNSNDYGKSILELDFSDEDIPVNRNYYDLKELSHHIWHQLRERSNFVKPENKIVGNIYFDLGNVLAQTKDVQAALGSYNAAKEYGFTSQIMEKRIVAFEKLAKKTKPYTDAKDLQKVIENNFWTVLCITFILLGLVIKKFHNKTLKKKNPKT